MSPRPQGKPNLRLAVALTVTLALPFAAWGQIAGESVNMVSGTGWPGGDPFLQRQNEPSIAVSSANPGHLLAGANDYRTVDLPNPNVPDTHGDAWLGVFKSFDGGQTWQSVLLPGYPQDTSPAGLASPLHGFTAASDPLVRAGTNGMLYYSGIVFDRGTNLGRVFVARFIDLNNKENGDATVSRDPIQYLDGQALDAGTSGQFLDKPWLATDIPRAGAGTCTIPTTPQRSFPAGNVYFAYAVFTGNSATPSSKIMFTRSQDCGKTWSTPIKLSESNALNQGTTLAVDPVSGAIHLVWRRFATGNQTDALVYAKSTDFGRTFSKGQVLFNLGNPFDQDGATGAQNFRSEAFPTLAVSVDSSGTRSWVHLAWAQREPTTGDAQVVVSTSTNGTTWSAPAAVDEVPLTDDAGNRLARGHQFMPQLTFTQGQLMLLYYDSRLDHTAGWFTPYPDLLPDSKGRFYTEQRAPLGELLSGTAGVFTPFIDDALLTQRRHTIDVRVAQASPGLAPAFTSARVSNFLFGGRGDEAPGQQVQGFTGSIQVADSNGLLRAQQLQFNPPNLPLFAHGTIPFIGDYIDIAGPAFVAKAGGGWAFNTAPTTAATHYAVWTSNQDVRPPPDGDWTKYTPPSGLPTGTGGMSLFDPTQARPPCVTGYEGTRNQNVYSARISNGLVVSSPQNVKPLASTLTRAFVVAASNATSVDRAFRFSATASGVVVSFTNNLSGGVPLLPAFDVVIPSQSTVHRSVFARLGTATDPGTPISVRVDEVDPSSPAGCLGLIPPTCKVVAGGLSGFLTLNPPGMVAGLVQPDGTGADIQTIELYTPTYGGSALDNTNFSNTNFSNTNFSNTNLSNTNLSNTNFSNTNLSNSSLAAAHVSNAEITNLSNTNFSNTNFSNTNFSNTNLSNTNFSNTNLSNTNLSNAALSDANYVVTNTGNTTHSYHVKIVGNVPSTPLQLILAKNYTTPLALGCLLVEQPHPVIIASVDDIRPAIQPLSAPLADPNIPDPSGTNATLALAPGESAVITLRGLVTVDGMKQIVSQLAPVTVPHAGGSFAAALLVASDGSTLPTPQVGVGYSATLQAIGGTEPYTWSFVSGTLPIGLSLLAGQILGTPTSTGSFTFTVQVADRSQPTNTAQRSITLNVGVGPTTTTLAASPAAPVFGQSLTLTVAVSAASSGSGTPLPSGTVTFQDGGALLGTASLQGGSASLTVPGSLSVGSHSFSATYGGDSSYAAGGTSSPISAVVGKAQGSVALASSASPSFFGQSVDWTATVTAAAPGAGTPTGVVTFSDGGTVVGTSTLASGVATFTPTALQPGTHSVSASYSGDASFLGGSGALSQVVNPASTSIALSSSAPSTAYGLPVTFTATLAVTAGVGTPTGTINFTDGGASIGTGTLSSGVATFTISTLGAGTHQITAVFGGNGSFGASTSGVLVEAVAMASTATSVTSSLTPSTFGQSVTFTATVSVSSGAGTPGGTVTFADGGAAIGTVALSFGVATLTSSTLAAGTHQITAVYGGGGNFGPATSGFIVQSVSRAATSTTLSSSPNPSTYGQAVTFKVKVASSVLIPTGTVTFTDSGTALGTATLDATGTATFSTTALLSGTHAIVANYAGDTNFTGSVSVMLSQGVGSLYSFTGFFTPLVTAGTATSPSYSGTQNFGKGLPVKWSLQDAKTGTVISSSSSLTSVQAIANPACVGPPLAGANVLVLYSPLTGATGGSSFKFSTNQFAFTWDTSTAPGRGCYNLVVKLNDGTQKATIVNLQ